MAWKLDIDLETLETENPKLEKEIGVLSTEIQEMDKLISRMADYWEGDAAIAYINAMRDKYTRTKNTLDALTKLHAAVNTQISELRENDKWFEKLWYGIWHW